VRVLIVAALSFALSSVAPGRGQGRTLLEARFIGNMAYALSDSATTLFTDFPYESGYSVYMEYDTAAIRSSTQRSLALITHRHRDHWDQALFDRTNWRVVGPEDAVATVAPARVVRALPVASAPSSVVFDGITIDALPTPHARIGHYSYLVTWHGRRLYFTGDTDDAEQLLATKNIDVAFVSPWLFQRTLKSGRRIDARRIVIYHQTVDESSVPGCSGTCSVPKQGDTLRLQ
jgi:L-ascorbate metabolism protein UlaG (beta-lactamase superfamily)